MQGRTGRPVASDHKRSSANRRGRGDARRSERRVDGECLLRRLEAALNGLPARIAPATARVACAPRTTRPLSRKTLPHSRMSRRAGVHRGQTKV